jgi:hypothetical protein
MRYWWKPEDLYDKSTRWYSRIGRLSNVLGVKNRISTRIRTQPKIGTTGTDKPEGRSRANEGADDGEGDKPSEHFICLEGG